MKNRSLEQKILFNLLMVAAVIAIAAGWFLGLSLSMQVELTLPLPIIGLLLWTVAWGAFFALCLRLRKGESAFTPFTGKALSVIGLCMVGLAAVTFVSAFFGSLRMIGFFLIESILLPGLFLAVAAVAKILGGLLTHAMAIEKEQEGVV